MSLPPELRNEIYKMCFCYEDTISIDHSYKQYPNKRLAHNGLLQASSRIRREASPIFYRMNSVVIGFDPSAKKQFQCMVDWLRLIIEKVRQQRFRQSQTPGQRLGLDLFDGHLAIPRAHA